MTKSTLSLLVAILLSAAAGSALTWLVALPCAVADMKATLTTDEQAQITDSTTKAVQAQISDLTAKAVTQVRAEEKAWDHDAVARFASASAACLEPVRRGTKIPDLRRILLHNAAAMDAVETGSCPPAFQEVYRQAAVAMNAHVEVIQQAPISGRAAITDVITLCDTDGLSLPVVLDQAAHAETVFSSQAAALERVKVTLARLERSAARYGVRL